MSFIIRKIEAHTIGVAWVRILVLHIVFAGEVISKGRFAFNTGELNMMFGTVL